MNFSELCVIIPCHNESECIGDVLRELYRNCPGAKFVVVDDASSDDTRSRAESANVPGTVLLKLSLNLGIGGAVQTGFRYAAVHGFRYAVKFDGDGQHPADQIVNLLEALRKGDRDLAIGSRFLRKEEGFQSTFARRIGIRFYEVLNSLLIGQVVTDNTSGFRAYNREAILFAALHYPAFDYPEPEEVILFAKNGLKICEVPVKMRSRLGGTSSINHVRAAYYMLKVTFSVLMAAVRPKENARFVC